MFSTGPQNTKPQANMRIAERIAEIRMRVGIGIPPGNVR